MPQKKTPAPIELTEWMTERIELLNKLIRRVKTSHTHQDDDKQWTLNLLDQLSGIETTARRGVHLLTAHALRDGIATPTEVSKVSDVTISAAISRAGSKLAQEVWNEAHPPSK